MKCPTCNQTEMTRKNVPFFLRDLYMGDYEADVCPICRETLFTEEASRMIDDMAVTLGVWGKSRVHEITIDCAVSTVDVGVRPLAEIFGSPELINGMTMTARA